MMEINGIFARYRFTFYPTAATTTAAAADDFFTLENLLPRRMYTGAIILIDFFLLPAF